MHMYIPMPFVPVTTYLVKHKYSLGEIRSRWCYSTQIAGPRNIQYNILFWIWRVHNNKMYIRLATIFVAFISHGIIGTIGMEKPLVPQRFQLLRTLAVWLFLNVSLSLAYNIYLFGEEVCATGNHHAPKQFTLAWVQGRMHCFHFRLIVGGH